MIVGCIQELSQNNHNIFCCAVYATLVSSWKQTIHSIVFTFKLKCYYDQKFYVAKLTHLESNELHQSSAVWFVFLRVFLIAFLSGSMTFFFLNSNLQICLVAKMIIWNAINQRYN